MHHEYSCLLFYKVLHYNLSEQTEKKYYESHFGKYIWRDLKIGLCLDKDVTSISTFW